LFAIEPAIVQCKITSFETFELECEYPTFEKKEPMSDIKLLMGGLVPFKQ